MKKEGKPVETPLDKLDDIVKKTLSPKGEELDMDFSNTEIAFSDKSNRELNKAY